MSHDPSPSRPLRVLVIAPHTFYTDRGTPIDVDLLVRALSQYGAHIDLLVYPDGEARSYDNVTVHRAAIPARFRDVGPGFSVKKVFADWYLFHRARELARANRYDLVHAGEEAVFIAMWLKRFARLPYVYDMDSSIAQQLVEKKPVLRPFTAFFNWCERRAVRGAVAAAPVCHALADLARSHGAARLVTLHDISQLKDPDREATGDLRRRLRLTGDEPLLMYVGNLEPYQGVDLLLEAFAIAVRRGARAHLTVVGGSDSDIAAYRGKAERLGLNGRAHLLGRWPVDQLDALLAEADILTAPRIRGINTPMKVFPYLHSGKPVLVTDLPTHSQVLTPEVAMLAPADPAGFAEAIVKLSEDAALRERLGRAGRAFVERDHTYDAHRRRVFELYDEVTAVIAQGDDDAK